MILPPRTCFLCSLFCKRACEKPQMIYDGFVLCTGHGSKGRGADSRPAECNTTACRLCQSFSHDCHSPMALEHLNALRFVQLCVEVDGPTTILQLGCRQVASPDILLYRVHYGSKQKAPPQNAKMLCRALANSADADALDLYALHARSRHVLQVLTLAKDSYQLDKISVSHFHLPP